MNIFKGNIITCDSNNTIAEYLVEEKGRIEYIGDFLPKKYENLKITDLGTKALLPSFADTHMHFASFAVFNAGLNVMEVSNNVELASRLKEYVRKSKSKIDIAFGASPYSVEERKLISRRELDEVSQSKPIMVVKYDGHACIINQTLINKLDDKIKNLRGYDEETGEMNQEAFFAVSDFVTNSISPIKLIRNMQSAFDSVAEKGVGMIHSVSGVGFPKDLDVDLEKIVGKGAQRGFQSRIFFQTMDVNKVVKRKLPRIGGCFATALDGCFGSMDAALSVPYEGTDNKGVLYYSDEKVIDFCKKANRQGLQIELHAIGDAAFNQAAKALKAALDDFPRKDHRHGIIHACLPTEEGIKICAEYGIQIPLQTAFIIWPQEPDWYLKDILGEREGRLNPLKRYLDEGVVLSMGSDAPCTSPDPINWIYNACNHPVKDQSITVFQALRMATYYGYWTSFDEADRGSLEVGKIADMVILSKSPYDIPINELNSIKVEKLILSGKPYEKQKQNIARLIFKGLLSKGRI